MGSNDGAEICELVGIYLLHEISKKYPRENIGLYRDDGLSILRKITGRQADIFRKETTQIMKTNGLKIDIQCNLKVVDYLDITFNLNDGTHKPYNKPNNKPLYIHVDSNHPSNIIKQIPNSISTRISNNSSNEMVFNDAAPYYNDILQSCGYSQKLKFTPPVINEKANNKKRKRSRKVIWFNPPFDKSVETNVGKIFLNLVSKHFPNDHRYHKIFNSNTIKVSYSCMENMEKIIKKHNSNITKNNTNEKREHCNCRNKQDCPLEGSCQQNNIIYSAEVTHNGSDNPGDVYIGMSGPPFKERFANHRKSFNNRSYELDTELSKYIWDLKDKNISDYKIKWSVLRQTNGYNSATKKCSLCLSEKLFICDFKDMHRLINKKSELVSKCRHEGKYILKNMPNG